MGTGVRVVVVGAGVVGLSAALRLAEAGHRVDVLARDLPLETTSAVAAALWYPYRASPPEAVTRWAAETYHVLLGLARDEPDAAVRVRGGRELHRRPAPDPWWASAVPDLERLGAGERPPGYVDGWRFTAPVVDMSRYLPWLAGRVTATGTTLTRAALPALPTGAGVVVNCSGLAARSLAHDATVTPVRGQVVRVAHAGFAEWTLDETDPARPLYVVPRIDDVVVGGTAEEGSWDRAPDPATARDLLARAAALEPRLAAARVLGHRVGLRPARPAVRLETEQRDGRAVVHCYGHGGAGVTLSWGCAADVVRAVDAIA